MCLYVCVVYPQWNIVIKKSPIGDFFNLLHSQPIFYDPLRDDDSEHRGHPWSTSVHETRVCEHDVF